MGGRGLAARCAVALLACGLAGAAAAQPTNLAQLSPDRLLPGAARERAPAPIPDGVPFVVRFGGAARGLEPGAAVEINGIRVGAVRSVRLEYDAAARRFVVATEIVLLPEALPPVEGRRPRDSAETAATIAALIEAGLRARMASTRLVGGEAVVALAMVPEAPAARLGRGGALPEIPAAPTRAEETTDRLQDLLDRVSRAPVEQMVADLQEAMAGLKALVTGPELRETLAGLRDGAAELRIQVARLGARADPFMASLNETVRNAGRTIGSLDRQLGDRSPLIAEMHALLREMNGAARSMRLMADYLERNPDALLRGKSDSRR